MENSGKLGDISQDELYEMNKMIDQELSKLRYESDNSGEELESIGSSPVKAPLNLLKFNSNYNLVQSNWHFANQNYHKIHDLLIQQQKHQQQLILSPSIVSIPKGSRFFVIKSFNEQDIKSSFIHKIWSSTDLGNKRLSRAFNFKKSNERIFLIFSVNGSGQFCGIAEMKSNYLENKDNNNNDEQIWLDNSRFKGKFQIQWLFAKNISNNLLRHLRFQVSEFEWKPVTNSRDTQELPFELGEEIVNIFKSTYSTTSFLQKIVI